MKNAASKGAKKQLVLKYKDGTTKVFSNVIDAAKALGIGASTLWMRIADPQTYANKPICRYKKDLGVTIDFNKTTLGRFQKKKHTISQISRKGKICDTMPNPFVLNGKLLPCCKGFPLVYPGGSGKYSK